MSSTESRPTARPDAASESPAPPAFDTIGWRGGAADGCAVILDQTLLPAEERYLEIRTVEAMWEAIRLLRVRGAPAIGVAAAYGVHLGVRGSAAATGGAFLDDVRRAAAYLESSRPTAVNLAWAVRRMVRAAEARRGEPVAALKAALFAEAEAIRAEDERVCRRIGEVGQELIRDGDTFLTHCNAGALATARWGTALSLLFVARELGKRVAAYADETRPLLQGARLTAWELQRAGIPVTLICDNMAATVLASGRVQGVVVGADRIAANGDVANKIGTYGVALAAAAHGIPFYVAAPLSTVDLATPDGAAIPIEERPAEEITHAFGRATAPAGVAVFNPAFDVTPARLVTAIVTEQGICRAPFGEALRRAVEAARGRTP